MSKYSRQSRSPCVTKGGTFYYPYYLAYATGVLDANNFKVKLVDAVANEWSHGKTLDFVKKFKPDLTVLDTSTPSIINDVNFASSIKDILPSAHTNLVGTHVTNLPKDTLEISNKIDSICLGEYDYTVLDLAKSLEKGKNLENVDGLIFREKNKIKRNKDRKLIKNLDELPFVSGVYKKHLDIEKYFYASVRHPQVTILTARGCPFNCSFCNIPFKSSYRSRSPENVLEEFQYIESELPEVKEVMIEDDTFPVLKERTVKICDLFVKNKINLKWSCNTRVNTDFETLKKMKNANCRLLCVGFESPEQNILNKINKGTTKDVQITFMENCNKIGLLVNGCFILGLPGDTKESIRKTIDFAKFLNPDTAQFYPIMIYPGTSAFEWAKTNGYIVSEDYSDWLTENGWHKSVVSRPDLTNEYLLKTCDKARLGFYLRPRYIIKRISMLNEFEETKRLLKSGKTFFNYLLRILIPGDGRSKKHL